MKCETLSEALAIIANQYGSKALRNIKRVYLILTDLLPERKDLRNTFKHAVSKEILKKLDDARGKPVDEQKLVMYQCVQHCLDNLPLKQDVVKDVLWAYAVALGWEDKRAEEIGIVADVYVAGYENDPQDESVATVWKNGKVMYWLTDGNSDAWANSIFVSDGNVYVAGYEKNQQGYRVATVWRNGRVLYRLAELNSYPGANSIFVSGGDVYASGYEENSHGMRVATIWKNGKVQYCLTNGSSYANAFSIFVLGGNALV